MAGKMIGTLAEGVGKELRISRAVLPASGRRVVEREALAEGQALFREVKSLVDDLVGGHAEAKEIFSEAERCYRTVLAKPNVEAAKQARLEMEELQSLWKRKVRGEVEKHLTERAKAVHKLGDKEAVEGVSQVLKKLDGRLEAQSGFTEYASIVRFDDPEAFSQGMRKHLAESKSPTSPAAVEELSDVTTHMSFLGRPPEPVGGVAKKGEELIKDLRSMEAKGAKVKKSEIPGMPTVERQIEAVSRLEHFCPEADVLYDDVADIVDRRFKAESTEFQKMADSDSKFVNDLVDKVQGRTGEILALRDPQFSKEVWEPAQGAAEQIRDMLNKTDIPDVPVQHQWRVEVLTEPAFATTARGRSGELLDSGIYLVRESPHGNWAMPIFALDAKSGELRGSIAQQVLNQERMAGGLIDLPTTGRRYQIVLPVGVDTERALATTRTLTDKRILGLLESGTDAAATLAPGDRLITVTLPMSRSDIRAASYAMVMKRLERLKMLGP
jgi:hypothetical protein